MANKFCPECGNPHAPDAKFCASCGAQFAPAPTPQRAEAGRPQAVIPRSAATRAGGQQAQGPASSQQFEPFPGSRPSTPARSTSTSSAPVTIVIQGQQASGNQYAGYRGYRCATCGSFLYDGGPMCGCGFGFTDFLALGLEMEAVGDLFSGDPGDAMGDLVVAGMLSGGGIGLAPYGGGLFGGGSMVGDFVALQELDLMAGGDLFGGQGFGDGDQDDREDGDQDDREDDGDQDDREDGDQDDREDDGDGGGDYGDGDYG